MMNERIKELADQAELTIRTSKGTYMSHPEFNKKFAELLVRECIGIVKQRWINPDEDVIAEEIKQHFGVEE
jgi:hypothetical protein